MVKIFFFQKRNTRTGELLDEFVDCDERTAWSYYGKGRFFKLVGWSDGRFMLELRKKLPRLKTDKKTGMKKQPTKTTKNLIYEACKKELEFAKSNPDKTPPRDLTKMGFGGKELIPQVRQMLEKIK